MAKAPKQPKKNDWQPLPKQIEALESPEFEILYGGARGGAKTEAGIAWLSYDVDNPLFRALVIRRNADDLKDWGDRAERFYSQYFGATRRGNPPEFVFPSGAKIRTGHLKDEGAYTKYQGHEYHKILIEELTQIPMEDNYLMLVSSCRSTSLNLLPQVFSTTNPDGVGHKWVKKRWQITGTPRKNIRVQDPVTGRWRIFIPARVEDNPHLTEADPEYVNFLEGLPDGLRQQWRDGSWDDFDIKGAVYQNECSQALKEGRVKLVPHEPKLPVHTVWDLGLADTMVIGFWQKFGREMRLIGCYHNSGFGLKHYIAYLQKVQMERSYRYGQHFAPHDVKVKELSTGKTRIQAAKEMGIDFIPIKRLSVEAGIEAARLMFPRIYFSDRYGADDAYDAIKAYKYQWDENLLTFRKVPVHDWTSHFADMLRYTATIEGEMTTSFSKNIKYKQPPYKAQSEYEGGVIPKRGIDPQDVRESQPTCEYEGK